MNLVAQAGDEMDANGQDFKPQVALNSSLYLGEVSGKGLCGCSRRYWGNKIGRSISAKMMKA
jgi:hypothetical protein